MTTAVIYLRVSTKDQATRGNEAEGFSIPAQRDACERKAVTLGATVVQEFVDAGESARSADRPELQRMLAYLASNPTTYVIVHKVDRLARSRADDVQITLAIQAAGSTLVSVTENIDSTPSGALLHGIMSSIAEFYSRNLANEIVKGTKQKARSGGTPTIAPIGYLNVRETANGREIRTIQTDPDRAHHIQWAFEQYATGEWTLRTLSTALNSRGLSQRPTPNRPARPLPTNKLHKVLRNRYYLGYVTWQGIEYPGNHEPLIDPATFDQVQHTLTAHQRSGERSSRRKHHLAGSLYCGRCNSKLIYAISTGRHGGKYGYWFCIGRHTLRNGCDLPYLPEELVTTAVVGLWRATQLPTATVETIRNSLTDDLVAYSTHADQELTLIDRRIKEVERERLKWADLAMDGTVPRDIAREKQTTLAIQLSQLKHQMTSLTATNIDNAEVINTALDLLGRCSDVYENAPEATRRDLNQAYFERMLLDSTDGEPIIKSAELAEIIELIATAEQRPELIQPGKADLALTTYSTVRGSKIASLVELRGLEPLTPTLPVWCATSCAIAPCLVVCSDEVTPRRRALKISALRTADILCYFLHTPNLR